MNPLEAKEENKNIDAKNQATNTKDCPSCRQKVAQSTFDILTKSPNPLVETSQIDLNTTIPSISYLHTNDVIDLLYGGDYCGEDLAYIPGDCWGKKPYGTYSYPGEFKLSNYFKDAKYLKSCKIFFGFTTYLKNSFYPISVPVDISIEDCCDKFIKDLYCASTDDKLSQAFDNFKDCILNQIYDLVNDMKKSNPDLFNPETPPIVSPFEQPDKQIANHINKIIDEIEQGKNWFINGPNYMKKYFSGFGRDNSESCICIEGGEPVYCCNPNSNKEECYCADGSLKNLCTGCEESNNEEDVTFYLPYDWIVKYFENDKLKIHCFGTVIHSDVLENKFSYSVTNLLTGETKHSKEIYPENLPFLGDPRNKYFRKVIISLPKYNPSKITFNYILPCSECECPSDKRRIIKFIIDDFNFKYYNSLSESEKQNYCQIYFNNIFQDINEGCFKC